LIYSAAGRRANFKILNRARFEIPHQYLDSRKARKVLRWKPKVGLEEGLKITVSWYRKLLTKR
jgi:nucleoside-diphosphate-sugar epimerase